MTDQKDSVARRRHWLTEHLRHFTAEFERVRRSEQRWSLARLASFALAVGAIYPLRTSPKLAVAAVAALLCLFAFAIRRHLVARGRRQFLERQITVIQEAQSRFGGSVVLIRDWRRPNDDDRADGITLPHIVDDASTWTLTNQECDDLDLFAAPVGIFGLLNRTSTIIGASRLYTVLTHPRLDSARIQARQDAVKYLDDRPEIRMKLMAVAAGWRGRDQWLQSLIAAIGRAQPLGSRFLTTATRVWGALSAVFCTVLLIAMAVGPYSSALLRGLALLLVINVAVYLRWRSLVGTALRRWEGVSGVAVTYQEMSRTAATSLSDDGEIGAVRDAFSAAADPGAVPALVSRLRWANGGGMLHALCNLVFFLDFQVADSVTRLVTARRDVLLRGLAAAAELEALMSLACFAWESASDNDTTCYPTLSPAPGLAIEAGRHPLIQPDKCVPNNLHLTDTQRMWIVTGSNMAGKSTFLRMVATNALLAQLGTIALAKRMTIDPLRLITDLHAFDNLADRESYFLAEVRHVRRMVSPPDGEQPILGLIDEPFRGTNSAEQVAAGVAVVEHLRNSQHMFLVATHERRLTEVADGRVAVNHHFQETLRSDRMEFDYRLHPGPAGTRNALRVLEAENYPDSILHRARELLGVDGRAKLR